MTIAALAFLEGIMAREGRPAPTVTIIPKDRRRQPPVDIPATPAARKRARKHMARKGRERQLAVKRYFEARGFRVEVAYGKVHWIPTPGGKRIPIVKRHDFFKLWDLLVIGEGKRFLVQVGSLDDLATKRAAILDAGFPATSDDLLVGHEGGRRYRVLRGPDFASSRERGTDGRWEAGDAERIEVEK